MWLRFAESLAGPHLRRFAIAPVARAGLSLGAPPVIDNSALPVIVRPFEAGAAVVVCSAAGFFAGLGLALGGVLIDGGKLSWDTERFPKLHAPAPSYHGVVWTELVKTWNASPLIARARGGILRDLGAAIGPMAVFQTLQGLETQPLRMREHNRNALAVAAYLSKHPKATKAIHPSVQTGEPRRRADAVLKGGYGALVGFELQGGKEAGKTFIDALKLLYRVANIGDARSLAIHPATTTHSQLSPEDQQATGVSDGYVRLSAGIEHIDDILADLAQALDAA